MKSTYIPNDYERGAEVDFYHCIGRQFDCDLCLLPSDENYFFDVKVKHPRPYGEYTSWLLQKYTICKKCFDKKYGEPYVLPPSNEVDVK